MCIRDSCKGGEIQRTLRASAYLNEHPTHRLRSSLVPADILFDEDGCWRSAEKTGTNKRRRYNNGKEDPQNRTSSYIPCLLYTSDAADEEDSVDLGGRRIIKKKKTYAYNSLSTIMHDT
eukprot:TRINITY_DN7205_c0_g1_i9.p1 TRINITY_DN7205_c0_g1~~TRINITY_DN7205_c0_g1_i9.p1  ORF type:complete len:119 (-),score=18.37 TRINITY_DN7205_c0_g1_i9:25-381(-)